MIFRPKKTERTPRSQIAGYCITKAGRELCNK